MRVCFYYEYKNIVGGVTSLLITLIKELRRQNVEVLLFNYKDGLIAQELAKEGITVNIVDIGDFDWEELDQVVFQTDVFVVSGLLEVFHRFFKINPKLIIYNINDYLCRISDYKFGISIRTYARKLIAALIEKNSLLLMDDTGIRNADEELGLQIKHPLFLPVPVNVPATNTYLHQKREDAHIVRLTYIGRSVDWKMYPLKKILDDIATVDIDQGKEIHFSIVVDSLTDLKKFINPDHYKAKKGLQLFLYEKIKPSEVNSFLLNHSDLNFGTGTSTLEGAKLGIPPILMDFSTKEMPLNYKYDCLYNASFYSLGRNAEKGYQPPASSLTMTELLDKYFKDDTYIQAQSAANYEYVQKNHAVENIVSKLVQYADKATFRIREVKPYNLHYSFLHLKLKGLYSLFTKGNA